MVALAGFAHAPVTKGILIVLSITSVAVALLQLKPFVHLQIHPHLDVHHQWYRLMSHQFAFTNSSELFLALLLFSNAGVKLERTFGTYKYASFLVVITPLYTALQLALLAVGYKLLAPHHMHTTSSVHRACWLANGAVPAGPWGPLFAIVYQHHCIIPHLWSIRVGHIQLTDKHIQTSSLCLLLAISQSTSSVFAATLGIVVSGIYRSNTAFGNRLQHYRVPLRVYRMLSLLLSSCIPHVRPPPRSWRAEPPVRPTLEATQARLAQHNPAVANPSVSRSAMRGLGVPSIASLLRLRTTSAPPAAQPPPPPPPPPNNAEQPTPAP